MVSPCQTLSPFQSDGRTRSVHCGAVSSKRNFEVVQNFVTFERLTESGNSFSIISFHFFNAKRWNHNIITFALITPIPWIKMTHLAPTTHLEFILSKLNVEKALDASTLFGVRVLLLTVPIGRKGRFSFFARILNNENTVFK